MSIRYAYFIAPILKCHDRRIIEVYTCSLSPSYDDLTRRLKDKADHWIDVSGKTAHVIAGMDRTDRTDRIDILVDLSGHTAHSASWHLRKTRHLYRLAISAIRTGPGYPR